jgi:uncharacterized protein (TIGR02145 family)
VNSGQICPMVGRVLPNSVSPRVLQGKRSGKGVEKVEDSICDTIIIQTVIDTIPPAAWQAAEKFYSSTVDKSLTLVQISLVILAMGIALTEIVLPYFHKKSLVKKVKKEIEKERKNIDSIKTEFEIKFEKERENFKYEITTKLRAELEKIKTVSYFIDIRDMQVYRTVKIGSQVWMAENLNYSGENNNIGMYYDNNFTNGKKYGRLYEWEQAIKACPKGWHLPTNEEWQTLINFVGGDNIAGEKLKSKSDWNNSGTDEFFFSALSGGLYFYDNSSFIMIGIKGVWWSATKINDTEIRSKGIDNDGTYVFSGEDNKCNLLSVRYVKD